MPTKTYPNKEKLKDNKQVLLDLISKQYGPHNAVVMDKALKTQDKQIEEAMTQGGMTANDIGKSLGIDLSSLGNKSQNPSAIPPQQQPQQPQQPQSAGILKDLVGSIRPATSAYSSAQVTPEGNLQQAGWLRENLGTSTDDFLKQLLMLSQVQQAPLEMQAEQRRLAGEERRTKQAERESIRQFGRSVGETEIPQLLDDYGVDVNTMVETYGIPAQIDNKTGERRWNLPDMYTQSTMAKNKPTTPEERKYLGDIFNAVDTTQEILNNLKDLGIQDPNLIGSFEVPEGFWSDMGPLSIPAKFNLAGQYSKDPKYSALKSKIERMFQQYRIVITGAQASDKELKSLRPLIINMTQRPGVFFATASDLVNEATRNADTRIQLMESAGRDTSKIREMLDTRKNKKTETSQPQKQEQTFNIEGKTYRIPADKVEAFKKAKGLQ